MTSNGVWPLPLAQIAQIKAQHYEKARRQSLSVVCGWSGFGVRARVDVHQMRRIHRRIGLGCR